MDRELIEYLDRKFQEVRTESGVIAEGLRTEIQQAAEGHDLLHRRIDALQEKMESEFTEVEAMIRFS